MKFQYRHLIIGLCAFALVLSVVFFFFVRQVHSELEQESERIRKVEAVQNTIGVADKTQERATYDPCGLTMVVCKDEEMTIKLQ
mgnify:CR=1 FL=1